MVVSAVILFAVVCGALFAFQRSLIYYPQPRSNPEGSILMTLPVGTATVHVSTRPHVGPAALIYFGGNAEDVSQDIPDLADAFPVGEFHVPAALPDFNRVVPPLSACTVLGKAVRMLDTQLSSKD
jgi:hypothetical protein